MENEAQQKKDERRKKKTLPFRMKEFWMISLCRCWLHAIHLGIDTESGQNSFAAELWSKFSRIGSRMER